MGQPWFASSGLKARSKRVTTCRLTAVDIEGQSPRFRPIGNASERHGQTATGEAKRPAPRLYLVTPVIEDAAAFCRHARDAIEAADVAAVLLRLKPAGERELINRIKALAAARAGQGRGAGARRHPEIVARAGADGAHLTGIDAFTAAVESLKPARIAGCGGLSSRDDAMLAGERGADYVMFGEPEEGAPPGFDAMIERVEWWAEVFEIPCVGFAASPQEVGPLAPPAPISWRSATSSGATRAAPRPRLPRRRPSRPAGNRAMSGTATVILGVAVAALRRHAASAQHKPPPAVRRSRSQPPPPDADLAYGAFQRGLYLSAFREATRRIEQKNDLKAMTFLGELYADGLGVPNDDKKAAEWYRLAAARGDREAIFALAMFRMTGRAGPADRAEAIGCSAAAKLGHVVAAYDLGCSISTARSFRGFQPRRRAVAHGRRCRQSAGAIRAGHLVQGRPRRGEGPAKKPRACSAPRPGGPHRRRDRVRHRAVQRHRRRQEREPLPAPISSRRRRRAVPRPDPARSDVRDRARHQGRSGRGRAMAPDRQGRRRQRSVSRRVHAQDESGRPRRAENKAKPWIARMKPVGPTPFPTAPPNRPSRTAKP